MSLCMWDISVCYNILYFLLISTANVFPSDLLNDNNHILLLFHLVNWYSLVFTQFYQRNGMKYAISDADQLSVEILVGQQRMACSIEYNDLESKTAYNSVKCAFTVRRSGLYAINIRLGPTAIRGSPFFKEFMPGKISSCIFRYCISHYFRVQLFSRFWTRCGNSRVVNFAIFLMLSLL